MRICGSWWCVAGTASSLCLSALLAVWTFSLPKLTDTWGASAVDPDHLAWESWASFTGSCPGQSLSVHFTMQGTWYVLQALDSNLCSVLLPGSATLDLFEVSCTEPLLPHWGLRVAGMVASSCWREVAAACTKKAFFLQDFLRIILTEACRSGTVEVEYMRGLGFYPRKKHKKWHLHPRNSCAVAFSSSTFPSQSYFLSSTRFWAKLFLSGCQTYSSVTPILYHASESV